MTFCIGHQAQGEAYLFHYTKAAGLAGMLESNSFRMSSLQGLNDPRESKPLNLGFSTMGGTPVPSPAEMGSALKEINLLLKEQVYLGCFTAERDALSDDGDYFRGYARARSWAQYADNHRGACLVFDRPALMAPFTAAVEAHTAGAIALCDYVTYIDRQTLDAQGIDTAQLRSVGAAGIARRWIEEKADTLFFWKNTDWQSESEYRLVSVGISDRSAPTIPIRDVLVGIILGEEFPVEESNVIADRLRRLKITEPLQIGRMGWRGGLPGCGGVALPGLCPVPTETDPCDRVGFMLPCASHD